MHRISMVGNDDEGREALMAMGLSVRPVRAGSRSWRHETANAQYDVLFDTVQVIGERFDVNLFRMARLGAASLPFTPAGSVMPGMAMFTGDGGYDTVVSVERVMLTEPVYDLDIDKTHNYIANGIVTHNSIYGWRGADIRNILDFEKDFPSAKVVRLEENYRSTQPILDLANIVIEGNTQRLGKTLRTSRSGGERVTLMRAADERDEAAYVVDEIMGRRRLDRDMKLRDVAILYRTNSQSRAFEEALRRNGLPYSIVGAVRFYDRREIRDVMSYLKLIANPADEEAFRRAIAVPRRGVGDQALALLGEAARSAGISMLDATARPDLLGTQRPGPRAALGEFASLIASLREKAVDAGVDELIGEITEAIRYGDFLKAEGPDAAERLDNVRELIESAAETVIDDGGEVGLRPLDHFLQRTSLVAGVDHLDPNADAVAMMTLHNAKGLEFPMVFVTGLEDGLFPLARAYDNPKQIEEERRLFYVGITRAERKLYLTYADRRRRNGEQLPGKPSAFLTPGVVARVEAKETIRARSEGRSAYATFGQTDFGDRESYRPSLRRPGVPVSLSRYGPARFADEAEVSQDAPAYRVGERVKHKTFGEGVIAELSGAGRELKVRIDFDNPDIGRKTLVAAQAGLERGWE